MALLLKSLGNPSLSKEKAGILTMYLKVDCTKINGNSFQTNMVTTAFESFYLKYLCYETIQLGFISSK